MHRYDYSFFILEIKNTLAKTLRKGMIRILL